MTTWEIQKEIHTAVKKHLKTGMSENELAKIISSVCPDWQGDLISGNRTAGIEGLPTEKIIRAGDVVLLDLQVYSDNQWSDLTRVYFMDGISQEQKDAYSKVKNALSEGEKLLRPGITARELWSVMHDAICSPYAFTHHGGHRISAAETVAEPRFVPENSEKLVPGMIVTLEPGFYKDECFGIRLENNYIITESGYLRLDDLSLDETEYIVKG